MRLGVVNGVRNNNYRSYSNNNCNNIQKLQKPSDQIAFTGDLFDVIKHLSINELYDKHDELVEKIQKEVPLHKEYVNDFCDRVLEIQKRADKQVATSPFKMFRLMKKQVLLNRLKK